MVSQAKDKAVIQEPRIIYRDLWTTIMQTAPNNRAAMGNNEIQEQVFKIFHIAEPRIACQIKLLCPLLDKMISIAFGKGTKLAS